MNVLIIDEEVPFPLNTGKRIRTYHLIKRLQEKHHIIFLCYENRDNRLPELPNVSFVQIKSPVIEQKGYGFYWALLKNVTSPRPYIVDRHYSIRMKEAAEDIVRQEKIDLLHCEWTPYTENIKKLLSIVPSILSAHNVESQIWERYFINEENSIKKKYIYHQWRKIQRYEKMACRGYRGIVTVSENDKIMFSKYDGYPQVTVVPNGVDEVYFVPQTVLQKPLNMVFSGSMDWRPNQDGVKFFLAEIYPLIQKEIPEASMTIVGRKPPAWIQDMANERRNVIVTGTVDDVRPYLAEAVLAIVPLRIGGGSRLKILEALAMKKLVLSTTVGAEGLHLVSGRHLLVRDTAQDFAKTAVSVLRNPNGYKAIAEEGRTSVLALYTWDFCATLFDRIWRGAVADKIEDVRLETDE